MERVRVPGDGLYERLVALMPENLGLLLLAFAAVLLFLTFVEQLVRALRSRRARTRQASGLWARFARKPGFEISEDTPGSFQAYAVHNGAERALHREIEAQLPQLFPARTRLLSQVSLDEFLYAKSKRDWWTISGKRVDFLLVDASFQPICAIEFQGAGHYGADRDSARNAQRRDWEKRRALRLANVPLVEIPARWQRRDLIEHLGDVTGRRPEVPAALSPDLPAGA